MTPRQMDNLAAKKIMGWRSMGSHWADGPSLANRTHRKTDWRPSRNPVHLKKVIDKIDGSIEIFQETNKNYRVRVFRREYGETYTTGHILWETVLLACLGIEK